MPPRVELQTLLEELLESENVYFQPPQSFKMLYPCIVYSRSRIRPKFAGNKPYVLDKEYKVTVIYKNPDSNIPDKLAALPRCIFDRHFINDNLYHDVFTIYY